MDKEFATLAELGLELNMPKSKLAYYRDCNLISPVQKLSSGGIYNRKETIKIIKGIEKLQSQGHSIQQIKNNYRMQHQIKEAKE